MPELFIRFVVVKPNRQVTNPHLSFKSVEQFCWLVKNFLQRCMEKGYTLRLYSIWYRKNSAARGLQIQFGDATEKEYTKVEPLMARVVGLLEKIRDGHMPKYRLIRECIQNLMPT